IVHIYLFTVQIYALICGKNKYFLIFFTERKENALTPTINKQSNNILHEIKTTSKVPLIPNTTSITRRKRTNFTISKTRRKRSG
ncbi:hypothetical protein, partial [Butyricimonas faecihominis]|uniref:hypothetical protein n=1 Tax=Butyricimonas faecihominis TaxID=1472416 RepID=UPI0019CFD2AF